MLSRIIPYWLWLLLAVPALTMAPALFTETGRAFHGLLHPSGEWSTGFLILTLCIAPLMYLTKGANWARWLRTNRCYFGVASFAYAAVHTYVYVVGEGTVAKNLSEATRFDIAMGWLAFAVFIPLAATSVDFAVKGMGVWWKWLQRWTYAAALLVFLHWASMHDWHEIGGALVTFAPLAALTLYQLWWLYLRPRPQPGAMACCKRPPGDVPGGPCMDGVKVTSSGPQECLSEGQLLTDRQTQQVPRPFSASACS